MSATAVPSRLDAEAPPDDRPGGSRLWVVGVRGGVGTSTIASALHGQDRGSDLGWPEPDTTVVLVTGPAVADTARLATMVDRCRLRGVARLVVAVVSDGHGRWPAATRARMRMIRDQAGVVAVPWVARWRWQGADDRPTAAWTDALGRLAAAVDTRPAAASPRVFTRRTRPSTGGAS